MITKINKRKMAEKILILFSGSRYFYVDHVGKTMTLYL